MNTNALALLWEIFRLLLDFGCFGTAAFDSYILFTDPHITRDYLQYLKDHSQFSTSNTFR